MNEKIDNSNKSNAVNKKMKKKKKKPWMKLRIGETKH